MTIPLSIRWVITLTLVAAVITLSIVPGQARPGDTGFAWLVTMTPTLLQKLMHFVIYAGLAWLWAWTLEGIAPRWLRLTLAFTLTVGLGAALEWYQTRVPGRFGTLLDVLLNAAGAVAGLVAALLLL
jgi:hypothetical protein